jgi:succinate dehydrogenase / fumarate reductase cytochrome b subunit
LAADGVVRYLQIIGHRVSRTETQDMNRLALLHRSTVGKKAVMAVSGLVLVGFVVVHLVANLQIFAGAPRLDAYARALHGASWLLWGGRVVLVLAFVLHVVTAIDLARIQRAARPVDYRHRRERRGSLASRTMLPSGVLLAVFVVVHLANLTWGNLHPHFVPLAAGQNVVRLFRFAPASVFYLIALPALGLHVGHGARSLFQSLGVSRAGHSAGPRRLAAALGVITVLGFASIVVGVLLGRVG